MGEGQEEWWALGVTVATFIRPTNLPNGQEWQLSRGTRSNWTALYAACFRRDLSRAAILTTPASGTDPACEGGVQDMK